MNLRNNLDEHMKVAGGWEISRRYFVMNGFDGILTVLGIVVSNYLLGIDNPKFVIGTGIAACIAIGISGFWIAYLTEEAEQHREQIHLENLIFTSLDDTLLTKSGKIASWINALVDGGSPFLFGTLCLLPFILVDNTLMSIQTGYLISVIIATCLLFILGVLLGKISSSSSLKMGLKTLFAGLLVGLIIILLER